MLACQAKKGATELVGVISSNFQIRAESLPKKNSSREDLNWNSKACWAPLDVLMSIDSRKGRDHCVTCDLTKAR